ncbi:MAG: type II secretion system F family protein [Deltaproteobacteria bacterium]|jgi:tight adherence protein C|nr:type II secretion system F family protein [Deltaproteobacteria bacterium]
MSFNALTAILFIAFLIALYLYALVRVREMKVVSHLNRLLSDNQEPAHLQGVIQVILSSLAYPLAGVKERANLAQRLSQADFRRGISVNVFLVAKMVLVIFTFFGVWNWLNLSLESLFKTPIKSLQLLFFTFLAARLPDWWLSGKIKERMSKIRASVPQAVDYLTICVESGLGLEEAFERVVKEIRPRFPEVASEFRITRVEMLVMDRVLALKRLEKRSGVRELATLANSLLQSIQYGTPLTNALRSIAVDCRANQISELEERAGAISAKVGIPLVLLILFPLVAIIAAPAVISLIRTFGNY